MRSSRTFAPVLLLRVSNRSIFPLWAGWLAGLVLLAGGLVLFAQEAPPTEAGFFVVVGLVLVVVTGARILYVRMAALYTVSMQRRRAGRHRLLAEAMPRRGR